MSHSQGLVATRLDQAAAEFSELEPRERLELLLEYAESLRPIPARYQAERDAGHNRVQECQTPVFLWVELNDGLIELVADVAPEAPTVKGFVGVLASAFSGAPAAEVLAVEPNLVQRLGLVEALGMVRMRGLQAIQYAVRQRVLHAVQAASENGTTARDKQLPAHEFAPIYHAETSGNALVDPPPARNFFKLKIIFP